jgi:SMC interacting uncharacterized protein involved in chromosome segregation
LSYQTRDFEKLSQEYQALQIKFRELSKMTESSRFFSVVDLESSTRDTTALSRDLETLNNEKEGLSRKIRSREDDVRAVEEEGERKLGEMMKKKDQLKQK